MSAPLPAAARTAVAPGVILCDKPAGVTSHDIVARARRELPRKTKVGHAGTLDPFATGLLLVLVGRATRVQRFLLELPKTYRVVARLGWTSSTGDRDGELTRTDRMPAQLVIPTGEIMQRPPAYSAVRVDGERLYEKARRGEAIEGEPRRVSVHRAELLDHDGEHAEFEIECSSGTYVRQLIAGLGDAYCTELRRTRIGDFDVTDADTTRTIGLGRALDFLPAFELDDDDAARIANGVAPPAGDAPTGRPVRVTCDGELLAIAERRGEQLAPVVVFAS